MRAQSGRDLRATVLAIVSLGLLAPIAAGLWQTGQAAFGTLPALGRQGPDFSAWRALAEVPGLATALRLTLVTGLGATLLSLAMAFGFCAAVHGRMSPQRGARMLTPFLAMPHAAMAIGLAFVLAPSGWIARAMAPVMGWDRPPDLASINDPMGLALILGLMVKEVPFLLLVILSALTQIPVRAQMAAGRALGYGRGVVWIKVILPQVWPLLLPEAWSLRAWTAPTTGWATALHNTTLIALTSTGLSLALAIAWLEGEDRARRGRARWAEAVIYLPLMVPQVSFLFGMNVLLLHLGASGNMQAVIWAHSLFVFPYVMIALSDPWRALDPRLDRTAASLGARPWRRLVRVKLPVLLAPLCTAAAIGVAVSVAQYLPTLFLGSGRVATLTTEAVTLASSSDRRVTGVFASLQAALPFVAYLAAFAVPAILHRNRRDLKGQASS